MLFGTNLTRRALREPPFVIVVVQQYKLRGRDSWRVTTPHVQSLVVISMLRGQPKTPPSGDDLAVLDYHLNENSQQLELHQTLHKLSLSLVFFEYVR